jgi:hypothetical protein
MLAVLHFWRAAAGDTPIATPSISELCADRSAIEKVYYTHRLGKKPPFDEAMPAAAIEEQVRVQLKKERLLKTEYGIEISGKEIQAEVNRINSTTRAPEMLAEIKTALGNDPARFARSMAKPILVDSRLRDLFENDENRHASGRARMEALRNKLLKMHTNGLALAELEAEASSQTGTSTNSIKWSFAAPPDRNETAGETPRQFGDTARSANYSISGSVQPVALPLPAAKASTEPLPADDGILYFDDLPPKLRALLEAQLHAAGDVSAVVEMPAQFVIYLGRIRSPERLEAMAVTLKKPLYEDWIREQQ